MLNICLKKTLIAAGYLMHFRLLHLKTWLFYLIIFKVSEKYRQTTFETYLNRFLVVVCKMLEVIANKFVCLSQRNNLHPLKYSNWRLIISIRNKYMYVNIMGNEFGYFIWNNDILELPKKEIRIYLWNHHIYQGI